MENFINQSCYLFTKDIITFLLTTAGLVIASTGLATWKKQVKGTKEFETAYSLRYSILKLRNAVKHVRNPAIWPSESYEALQYSKTKYPSKSNEDIEKNSHAYVYEMRWEEITEASTEMESHLLAVEVLWGSEILNLIKPLNIKITELSIYLKQYFQPEFRTKDYKDIHDIIYDKGDENKPDSFSDEINGYIKNIEDYLKDRI
jgi:hypothetical protein